MGPFKVLPLNKEQTYVYLSVLFIIIDNGKFRLNIVITVKVRTYK